MPSRSVTTDIWEDEFFEDLSRDHKLLWFYLITNSSTKLLGIYELRMKKVCRETGLTPEQVIAGLQLFRERQKVAYSVETKELAMVNWKRYNMHGGETAFKAVAKDLARVKDLRLAVLMYPYEEGRPLYESKRKVIIEHPLADRLRQEKQKLEFSPPLFEQSVVAGPAVSEVVKIHREQVADAEILSGLDPPVGTGGVIDQLIAAWNSHDVLPHCRYVSVNIPNAGAVLEKVSVFGVDAIMKAVENLVRFWEDVEPVYRPTSLDRFLVNSLDRWVDDARPWERYEAADDGRSVLANLFDDGDVK